jgi:hypothetical protein
MASEPKEIGKAVASPTKDFFVRMLTRDIELEDSVLDLLDNCVDGILRSGGSRKKSAKPYAGFHARIVMAKDYFEIEDNCGGIPFEVAQKYAFAMGRPRGAVALEAKASVGMYGIGMKRAIFKMGTDAIVESRHDTGFEVEFTPKWMQTDTWDELPMHSLPPGRLREQGTKILIAELREETRAAFSDSSWVENFKKIVARHYALIIAKGFEVRIGAPDNIDKPAALVRPEGFKLLVTKSVKGSESRIEPYIYRGTLDGVAVEIYAGLYRPLLTDEELESEEQSRVTADDAGWTVACNDRVVIWKDKTRLTGWGEATVPNFHGQFIAITGIVLLQSDDPKKLPLTTTKRGVDGASEVYLKVKELMRESTKALTSFTNKWKKFPDKLGDLYESANYAELSEIRAKAETARLTTVRRFDGMKKHEPAYPVPEQEKTDVRVGFTARRRDVEILRKHYFDDDKAKPGEVGERAFEEALTLAKRRR